MVGGREDSQSSIPITSTDEDGETREDPIATGTLINGKYRVLRLLGSGGMGTVVAARDGSNGQFVALKIMHAGMAANADSVRRFMREGRAAAMLVNDHTVRIYEVGNLETGAPFMAMEYLDGEDLEELGGRRKLGIEEVIDYVLQAIAAVSEAHRNGLVHRDLKPQNLFLARSTDGSSRIKVLDFGLAKDLARNDPEQDSGLTTDNMLIGSPHFMSPEQIRTPGQVDGRTDIWALGATLYTLLTGEPPFVSPTMFGLLACIMTDPAPHLCERKLDAPEALDQIIIRCLEKDPENRFATVDELGDALRRVAKRASSAHMEMTEDSGTLVMAMAPAFAAARAAAEQAAQMPATLHTPMAMPRPSYASFPALPSQFPAPPAPMVTAAPAAPATRIVVGIAMAIASALVLGVVIAAVLWASR